VNHFAYRFQAHDWVLPITGMCLVIGFLGSLAWVTGENRSARSAYLRGDQRTRVTQGIIDLDAYEQANAEAKKAAMEVQKLQLEKTKLENTLAKNGEEAKVLNQGLQEMKSFANLTAVEGPGVIVTLTDSAKGEQAFGGGQLLVNSDAIIHDKDVLLTVNELFASGAEAVSVNDLRVAATSSFRCVGPTILVNDVKIASPVRIRAIGDPDTLFGAMNTPGGSLAEIRMTDPAMVQVEKVEKQLIPAYTGTTERRFAKVPKEVAKPK
jgi:uncharacterized protein YlxW (UPF0749 family)